MRPYRDKPNDFVIKGSANARLSRFFHTEVAHYVTLFLYTEYLFTVYYLFVVLFQEFPVLEISPTVWQIKSALCGLLQQGKSIIKDL